MLLHTAGIVTRRPLVLQLVRLEDPAARAYGEFLHIGPRPFFSFGAPLCGSVANANDEQLLHTALETDPAAELQGMLMLPAT